jgi:hypothetical protein
VTVGFQGEVKKALVEIAPLRWDGAAGHLVLAKRMVVRLSFREREPAEESFDGLRGRRLPRERARRQSHRELWRLATVERGLYRVAFEEVMGRRARAVETSRLRLSRQGEAVAFTVTPDAATFGPGSTLYFLSAGERANPHGREAVYELEVGSEPGVRMALVSGRPSGTPTFYWNRVEKEQNRYYQAGLLEAPDLWLWDVLFAPVTKSYEFATSEVAAVSEPARLTVWLQGASDFAASPDHHLRVYLNGILVAETSWEGKRAQRLEAEIPPGVLREGENRLELENVGDTGATYSMVFLDRFEVSYPRRPIATSGRLEGSWSETGVAEVSGVTGARVLDLTEEHARWLIGVDETQPGTVRFHAQSGRRYLVVGAEAVLQAAVKRAPASGLRSERNQADYVVVAPREFLEAAEPLLALRRSQGLHVKGISTEDIASEFGFGEASPRAVQTFLSYAYHFWQASPRYVVLLGDATYDEKDYLGTGVKSRVPALVVKTRYLWTASDPTYAQVNGDDILPDIAVGRLPAASVEEVQTLVKKIVSYETGGANLESACVLVTDNPDRAGDFEANAEQLASGILSSRQPRRVYLSRLGTAATRSAILDAFDAGASLMSYLGHGGIHLWADENIFNTADVSALAPQSQQPLLLTMNCLNGYFHFPYFNSLSEEFVKAEGRGAVAAFSPSGLSHDEAAHLYHQAVLVELLSGRHARLGEALLAAQAAYAATGVFPELLSIYHLLGDPALRLK